MPVAHVNSLPECDHAHGQAIFMVDSKGLITTTRGDKLPEHKKEMARSDDTPNMKDLREIIAYVKPHALIGLSGAGPSFKQARPGQSA